MDDVKAGVQVAALEGERGAECYGFKVFRGFW
jgi:hypothetical protein